MTGPHGPNGATTTHITTTEAISDGIRLLGESARRGKTGGGTDRRSRMVVETRQTSRIGGRRGDRHARGTTGGGSNGSGRRKEGARNHEATSVRHIDESSDRRSEGGVRGGSGRFRAGRRSDGAGKRVTGANNRNNTNGDRRESSESGNGIGTGRGISCSTITTSGGEGALRSTTSVARTSRSVEIGGRAVGAMLSERGFTIEGSNATTTSDLLGEPLHGRLLGGALARCLLGASHDERGRR